MRQVLLDEFITAVAREKAEAAAVKHSQDAAAEQEAARAGEVAA